MGRRRKPNYHEVKFTINQKKKMRFMRSLFGYKTRRGKNLYSRTGILKEAGGEKLGANIIMVPASRSKAIRDFLKSFGVTPQIRSARTK